MHFELAYVGYTVLRPFVAYGVEAGLRYSDSAAVGARLERVAASWAATLAKLKDVPVSPSTPWRTGARTAALTARHASHR